MDAILVTHDNLYHIDFDSIVVFSYAEPGAMGEAGPPYEVSRLFPTDQNLMELFR